MRTNGGHVRGRQAAAGDMFSRADQGRACPGYCGVVRAPDRDFDELTYVFHQKFWGKGYATEIGREMLAHVFRISALRSISATIDPGNRQSKQVAAKLGMVETPCADNAVSHWTVQRPGNQRHHR